MSFFRKRERGREGVQFGIITNWNRKAFFPLERKLDLKTLRLQKPLDLQSSSFLKQFGQWIIELSFNLKLLLSNVTTHTPRAKRMSDVYTKLSIVVLLTKKKTLNGQALWNSRSLWEFTTAIGRERYQKRKVITLTLYTREAFIRPHDAYIGLSWQRTKHDIRIFKRLTTASFSRHVVGTSLYKGLSDDMKGLCTCSLLKTAF